MRFLALIRSTWVILFILICFMLYEKGMRKRNQEYMKLQGHFEELDRKKSERLAERDRLALQINSQSDPAWVELTLMRGLGLVPEGATKVYFKRRS